MDHQFVGPLGGGVETDWMISRSMHREGNYRVATMNRTRRGVDEVRRRAVLASFQYVQEARSVGVEIGMRVFQRIVDTGLGGQVYDQNKRAGAKQAFGRCPIREIKAAERESLRVSD